MTQLNKKELFAKIDKDEPVYFTVKYVDDELMKLLTSFIARYLSKMNSLFMLSSIIVIFTEALSNAIKANAKRVLFEKLGLAITNPEEYKNGMGHFKFMLKKNYSYFEQDLISSSYYIYLSFVISEKELSIHILNNSPIIPIEEHRIKNRMLKAAQCEHFMDIYDEIADNTEGGGLGIAFSIFLLKNIGLKPEHFKIECNADSTETTLIIPQNVQPKKTIEKMDQQLTRKIEDIPTFPEHVIRLQKLCNDPNSSIEDIVKIILSDPALTANIVKLANSACFLTEKPLENLREAVMTIGLKNVNALLTSITARTILSNRFARFEDLWQHCNKTAFYTQFICNEYHITKNTEYAIIAGLLHDLGKIVLLSTDRVTMNHIADISKNKGLIPVSVEEIYIGVSHSAIGALIARKWNFPEYLVEVIQYHHSPLNTSQEVKDIVYAVYLANMFCGLDDGKYNYYFLLDEILERFQLSDKKLFQQFYETIRKAYLNRLTAKK